MPMASLNAQQFMAIAQSSILAVINSNNNRLEKLNADEQSDLTQIQLMTSVLMSGACRERTVWRHPVSSDWWDTIYPNMTEALLTSHFRVDRRTFDWILIEIKSELFTMDTRFREATSVDRKLAVSLKSLATTCDLLTISSLFGIGKSSAHKYFMQFIHAMYKKVVSKMIKFPSGDAIASAASEFESLWGFPMAVAAIDGTHIPFNPPTSLSSDFHNYKGWSYIRTVAICDARGKAIWLKSGMPGRMSDSGAFKATRCYAKLARGDLLPNKTRRINGVDIPYMILGDSGFAMESWARRAVENMFGRVKLRWRRLLRGLDVKYENAHKVISVAFALHNICERNCIDHPTLAEEIIDNQAFENLYPQPNTVSASEATTGVLYRNTLMEYFSKQDNPWTG